MFESQKICCFVIVPWRTQSQSADNKVIANHWIPGLKELSRRDRMMLKYKRQVLNCTFNYHLIRAESVYISSHTYFPHFN